MVDVREDVLRPPHGTTPAAVKSNKKSEMRSFKSNENIHKKEAGLFLYLLQSMYARVLLNDLTHMCLVDPSVLINWTSPIRVCTVCLCPKNGTLGLHGLKHTFP